MAVLAVSKSIRSKNTETIDSTDKCKIDRRCVHDRTKTGHDRQACGAFLLLVATALAVLTPAQTDAVEPAAQPNILLIYADDLDADQLYDLDHDLYETPNLASDPAHAAIFAQVKDRLGRLLDPLPHGFGKFKPVTVETSGDSRTGKKNSNENRN